MLKTVLLMGVTGGFGRECAEEALRRGYRVIGTVTTQEEADAFEALSEEAFAYPIDLMDRRAMLEMVVDVERNMAPIDVLISTGRCGAGEDWSQAGDEGRECAFQTNVFVPMGLMKAVLPYMRTRRAGHIVTFPGLGVDQEVRVALRRVAASLASAVAPLGIHVTLVEPVASGKEIEGAFDCGSRVLSGRVDVLAELPMLRLERRDELPDLARAARAVFDRVESEQPALHLRCGSDVLRSARSRLARLQAAIDAEAS